MKKYLSKRKVKVLLFIISIIIILIITFFPFKAYWESVTLKKYWKIENWNDAKELFDKDLEKGELKYFSFGLGRNHDLDTLETKYGLEIIWMGDIFQENLSFYNHYVEKELFNKSWNSQLWCWMADTVWQDFKNALIERNVNFLIKNSFDSIYYSGVGIIDSNKTGLIETKNLYKNHLDKMVFKEVFSSYDLKKFETDSFIQITHSGYSDSIKELTYMFWEQNDEYLFQSIIID